MRQSTGQATHVVDTPYVEEADVDVEVNVHIVNSSIFSTETDNHGGGSLSERKQQST